MKTVAELKQQSDQDAVVLGSGELLRSRMAHKADRRVQLLIHPLVLGSGRRLFPEEGPRATLELVDSITTTTGVVIATYRPA